ncbi:MAG: hypothetical protein HY811_02320 [Planctomycetes bacterium]|nr:hypothetical protein [Planctomycetota bacterium]
MSRLFITAILLLSMLVLSPYGLAEGEITIDLAQWQKLAALHQEYYLGKRSPSQNSSIRITNEGVKGINQGEIFWQYLDKIIIPLQQCLVSKDNDKFIKTCAGYEKWIGEQSKKIEPLFAQLDNCQKQLEGIQSALNQDDKFTIPNKNGLLKQLGRTPDEISYILKSLIEKSPDKKSASLFLVELKSILKRINDVNGWVKLELAWLKENINTSLDYINKHPEAIKEHRFGAGGLPCVASIEWFHKDWVEFQRQIEDILCLTDAEKGVLGKPCLSESVYLAAPSQRKFYISLEDKLKEFSRIINTLRKSLETPYNLTYLNCLLDRYGREKAGDFLVEVMKNWSKVNPESKEEDGSFQDIVSLLEVLNYRQGTPITSESAKDQFDPHFMEQIPRFDGMSPAEAFKNAMEITRAWYGKMSYDKNRPTVADVFKDKKADCCNVTNICAYLLANAGYGNAYGVNLSGGHWVNAFADNGKIILRDCLSGPMSAFVEEVSQTFPDNFKGGGYTMRWVRTVAGGVESSFVIDGKFIRREIPYYNQKAEVIELEEKKDK